MIDILFCAGSLGENSAIFKSVAEEKHLVTCNKNKVFEMTPKVTAEITVLAR